MTKNETFHPIITIFKRLVFIIYLYFEEMDQVVFSCNVFLHRLIQFELEVHIYSLKLKELFQLLVKYD